MLHFYRTAGQLMAEQQQQQKSLEHLCKEMASFPLINRYSFYHICMKAKENAQEQNIMVYAKATWSSFDDYLKFALS